MKTTRIAKLIKQSNNLFVNLKNKFCEVDVISANLFPLPMNLFPLPIKTAQMAEWYRASVS